MVSTNTFLSGCDLETGSHWGTGEQNVHSKDEGGQRSLQLPRSSSLVSKRSHPLHDFLEKECYLPILLFQSTQTKISRE